MSILEQARINYEQTLNYYKSIEYDPEVGNIWSNNMSDIYNIYSNSTSAEEVISAIDRTFMYSINFPQENADNGVWNNIEKDIADIRENNVSWLLSKMESFPTIEESSFIYDKNKVKVNGKTFSGNFLRTYSIANRILKFNNRIENVLELGGGAGHQARTLMLLTNCKYTIVDLPETLFFSFIHLSLCFPSKKILYVSSMEDFEKIDTFDIVFIPAGLYQGLKNKHFNLFINTASMGEMNNKTIHKWMNFVQKDITIDTLFTLNRYLNTINDDLKQTRINENECSVSYDDDWKILHWEVEPEYCRCPFIDTLHSRYVEIIATRSSNLDLENKISLSNKLLQEVKNEDWYRLQNYSHLMTTRDNILVNDMTMNGCLFKLWESIRLHKNIFNLETILLYLQKLQREYFFEETYYYLKELEKLKNE